MSSIRANAGSAYMHWAKLNSVGRHNLATSGMVNLPLAELGVQLDELEINGPTIYGYEPLLETIARRYRVAKDNVVSAMGTSFANYLALAAVTEPGDEVLIEQPAYDPMLGAARYLGLDIKRFVRRAEDDFAVDEAEIERQLTPRTRAIVLCNLHNPSGALTPDSVLREIGELAAARGAYVVVDEVYREMLFESEPASAFHVDPARFVVTNSLTKAYGLSGLRCGWVLAPAEIAR
ncbi:MAG TPA: pyridoxal phosphate-dependent aminotransferase, partial [Terriglobales bacterium]|nr:pyridoxal phosphate-dependent aminotransferase [Terriglobales bacterium]